MSTPEVRFRVKPLTFSRRQPKETTSRWYGQLVGGKVATVFRAENTMETKVEIYRCTEEDRKVIGVREKDAERRLGWRWIIISY